MAGARAGAAARARGRGREPVGRGDARRVPEERAAARARLPRRARRRLDAARRDRRAAHAVRADDEPGAAAGRADAALTFVVSPPAGRAARDGRRLRAVAGRRSGAVRGVGGGRPPAVVRGHRPAVPRRGRAARRGAGRLRLRLPDRPAARRRRRAAALPPGRPARVHRRDRGDGRSAPRRAVPAYGGGPPTWTRTAISTRWWRRGRAGRRPAQQRRRHVRRAAAVRPAVERPARLRLGRPRRRRRPGRGAAGRDGRRARVPEPARRRVPRGAAAGRRATVAPSPRWPRRRDAVRRGSASRRDGAVRAALGWPPSDGDWRSAEVARVAPPPGAGRRARRGCSPRTSTTTARADLIARGPAAVARAARAARGRASRRCAAPPAAGRAGGRRPRLATAASSSSGLAAGRAARAARRAAARRPTAGRRSARARRRRPATSASTRSASAARSRSAPACTLQKQLDRRRPSSTSASARRRAATSSASSGPTASCSPSSTPPADTTVAATQRLKGSCPWLFAWNGREMGFVTDLIWRSPLGLRINAQATADVLHDRGLGEGARRPAGRARRRLRPAHHRGAVGDALLRPRSRCWSSTIPQGTEVFVDERFAIPPPPLRRRSRPGRSQPFAAARDDQGRDVSEVVRARDGRHLDFAGRGAYQGVTRDHCVEVELPDAAPRTGPLWLVAQRLGPSDRQLDQRRHRPGRARRAATASRCTSPTRAGRFRPVRAGPRLPGGQGQDRS